MHWEILSKVKSLPAQAGIKSILLKNRNIKNEDEFFNPKSPEGIKLTALGIKQSEIKKAIDRIKLAKKNKEKVIIYGDYDADGICATAILWESLNQFGVKVLPHVPDRFKEGYGINAKSVENLKIKIPDLKLIITVDNGIVGYEGIKKASELGIDVIVIDHHTKGSKPLKAYGVLHSTSLCGSGLSYLFSHELGIKNGFLELAAIGTVADQMPLIGINRSIVKFGLTALEKTKRIGLRALFNDSKIDKVGTYEINYIVAPRINAMGRLGSGIDSLRLLCTQKSDRAGELSALLGKTNQDRQKIVTEVLNHTLLNKDAQKNKVIVISHKSYHEGVIGLAAGKLAEEFFRPAVVLSMNGKISKASARSISGFNIIEAIKSTGLIKEGGGHPMAAGFTIDTVKIKEFAIAINKVADDLLTPELLERKIKIDCEIDFSEIDYQLSQLLKQFEPYGSQNYPPLFVSRNVQIISSKEVGKEGKHLKLKLKQGEKIFDAIWFNATILKLKTLSQISLAYSIEENVWQGRASLQLKVKDMKLI